MRDGSILVGAENVVVPYVLSRIPHAVDFGPCTALGVVRKGVLVGGVVYHNYRPADGDIMVSLAMEGPGWCLPQTVRKLFSYPFEQYKLERMTALIARNNKRSRELCEGLGFKLEGVLRRAIGRTHDGMIYGLLRAECRFLK